MGIDTWVREKRREKQGGVRGLDGPPKSLISVLEVEEVCCGSGGRRSCLPSPHLPALSSFLPWSLHGEWQGPGRTPYPSSEERMASPSPGPPEHWGISVLGLLEQSPKT